jgi:hypothetical protein
MCELKMKYKTAGIYAAGFTPEGKTEYTAPGGREKTK